MGERRRASLLFFINLSLSYRHLYMSRIRVLIVNGLI